MNRELSGGKSLRRSWSVEEIEKILLEKRKKQKKSKKLNEVFE